MTPRRVQPDVVLSRLREMRRLLDDLQGVGDLEAARLEDDRMLRHAVERILAALVDLAVSINEHLVASTGGSTPTTYRASFSAAADAGVLERDLADRLQLAAGMRNVLVHGYLEVDLDQVAQTLPGARIDVAEYVQQVAMWLSRHEDEV